MGQQQIQTVLINGVVILILFGAWLFGLWFVYQDTTRRQRSGEVSPAKLSLWMFLAIFPVVGSLAYIFWHHERIRGFFSTRTPRSTDDHIFNISTNIPQVSRASQTNDETSLWTNGSDSITANDYAADINRFTSLPNDAQEYTLSLEVIDGPGKIDGNNNLAPGQTLVGATPSTQDRFIVLKNDPAVSGKHARIDITHLEDISLTNLSHHSHTKLNARLLPLNEEVKLSPPLEFKLGNTTLRLNYLNARSPSVRQTQPPVYSEEYNALFNNFAPGISSSTRYLLRVLKGANIGSTIPLTVSPVLLGRDRNKCQIYLSNDPTVSSVHAELFQRGASLYIENRSQYGILVNDNSIVAKQLSVNDVIQLGEYQLRVEVTK